MQGSVLVSSPLQVTVEKAQKCTLDHAQMYMTIGRCILLHTACRFISVSGSADVKSSGISLGVSAVVKRDPQGRPALKTTGCAFNIGGLSVKFRKGIAG